MCSVFHAPQNWHFKTTNPNWFVRLMSRFAHEKIKIFIEVCMAVVEFVLELPEKLREMKEYVQEYHPGSLRCISNDAKKAAAEHGGSGGGSGAHAGGSGHDHHGHDHGHDHGHGHGHAHAHARPSGRHGDDEAEGHAHHGAFAEYEAEPPDEHGHGHGALLSQREGVCSCCHQSSNMRGTCLRRGSGDVLSRMVTDVP